MIRNAHLVEQFEDELARRTPIDIAENFRIFDALIELARAVGRWPPEDPLEGIEVDIEVARVLNGPRPD